MSIYDQMKSGPAPGDPNRYRFTPAQQPAGDPNRFRITPPGATPTQQQVAAPVPLRVGGTPTQQYQPVQQTANGGPPKGLVPNTRNSDGDRPYPYAPQKQNGAVEHWRPPTWREILKELGWRMLESGIQAVAYEIAYFFGNRRLGVPIYVQNP